MSLHGYGHYVVAVLLHQTGHSVTFASHDYHCPVGKLLFIAAVSLHICTIYPEAILLQIFQLPVEICDHSHRNILGGTG